MSQAMSERDIEDVLNSVRRLVAQVEHRNRHAPLVLTPAMRIDAGAPTPEASGEPRPIAAHAPADTPADVLAGPDAPAGSSASGSDRDAFADARPETDGEAGAGAADATSAEASGDQPDAGLPEPSAPQFSSHRSAGTVTLGSGLPSTLDEQALQAIVAQIVRDELHGKLGERITLAVRKLVRNEIARALDEERRK